MGETHEETAKGQQFFNSVLPDFEMGALISYVCLIEFVVEMKIEYFFEK